MTDSESPQATEGPPPILGFGWISLPPYDKTLEKKWQALSWDFVELPIVNFLPGYSGTEKLRDRLGVWEAESKQEAMSDPYYNEPVVITFLTKSAILVLQDWKEPLRRAEKFQKDLKDCLKRGKAALNDFSTRFDDCVKTCENLELMDGFGEMRIDHIRVNLKTMLEEARLMQLWADGKLRQIKRLKAEHAWPGRESGREFKWLFFYCASWLVKNAISESDSEIRSSAILDFMFQHPKDFRIEIPELEAESKEHARGHAKMRKERIKAIRAQLHVEKSRWLNDTLPRIAALPLGDELVRSVAEPLRHQRDWTDKLFSEIRDHPAKPRTKLKSEPKSKPKTRSRRA